jgi:hypothetical protein
MAAEFGNRCSRRIPDLALSYLRCRIAGVNSARFRTGKNDRAERYDRFTLDSNPGSYPCERTDPGTFFNSDRFNGKAHAWIRPIVVSRAEIGSLRYACVRTDANGDEVVNPRSFADPAVVAND